MEPEFLRIRPGFLRQPHMMRVILSPRTLITASTALVRTLPVTQTRSWQVKCKQNRKQSSSDEREYPRVDHCNCLCKRPFVHRRPFHTYIETIQIGVFCLTIVPFCGLFPQRFKTVQLFKFVQKHGDFLVPDSPFVPTRRDFAVFIRYAAFGQHLQKSMGLVDASILSAANQK